VYEWENGNEVVDVDVIEELMWDSLVVVVVAAVVVVDM
jgi:hypothetical protein